MMTLEEAIETIKLAQAQIEWDYPMDYAVAFDMAISALQEQEAKHSNESSLTQKALDTISRQAAIDAMMRLQTEDIEMYGCAIPEGFDGDRAAEELKALPSAQPERKTGRWLIREGISDAQCSECKMFFRDVYDMDNSDAFCRHCGSKMEGLKVVNEE